MITYFLSGALVWIIYYSIMVRTRRWEAEAHEFILGFVGFSLFWPAFFLAITAIGVMIGIHYVITRGLDKS